MKFLKKTDTDKGECFEFKISARELVLLLDMLTFIRKMTPNTPETQIYLGIMTSVRHSISQALNTNGEKQRLIKLYSELRPKL